MNHYQNIEARKYVVYQIFAGILITALLLGGIYLGYHRYQKLENDAMAAVVGVAIQENPEARETILAILNGDETSEKQLEQLREEGYAMVEDYGIWADSYLLKEARQMQWQMLGLTFLGMFLLAGGMIGIFLCYLKQRKRKLDILTSYMQRISLGNYQLNMEDNSEDELSNLKNEIYKIMVMLREQAKLAREQKAALADSVSDISHQLKTPLTSMTVLLDNLEDNPDMDPETRMRFIKEISHQIGNMNWMVITLLKLSRLDAGMVEFKKEPVFVRQLVEEAASNLEVIGELRGLGVSIQCPGQVQISGDYRWNREALQNILKNAMEHGTPGTDITIQVEDNSVYTAITVSNQGDAIEPEKLKHIFDRFYKVDVSREDSFGIGLSLAKLIVEQQNGYIMVESDSGHTAFTMKYIK